MSTKRLYTVIIWLIITFALFIIEAFFLPRMLIRKYWVFPVYIFCYLGILFLLSSRVKTNRLNTLFIWINLLFLFPTLFTYELIGFGRCPGYNKMGPTVIASSIFDFFGEGMNLEPYRRHTLIKHLLNNHVYGIYQIFSLLIAVLFMSILYFNFHEFRFKFQEKITFLKAYKFELIGGFIFFYLIYSYVPLPLVKSMAVSNYTISSAHIVRIIYVLLYFVCSIFVLFLLRKKDIPRLKTVLFICLFFLFPILSMSSDQFAQSVIGLEYKQQVPVITPLFSGLYNSISIIIQDIDVLAFKENHFRSTLYLKTYTIMELFLIITVFPILVKKYNNYVYERA